MTTAKATADLCDDMPIGCRSASRSSRPTVAWQPWAARSARCAASRTTHASRKRSKAEGQGRVLVVDGGGSRRHSLFGGNLGRAAVKNGWAGVIVYGCIRDSAELAALPLALRALGTMPLRSEKRGEGERDVPVRFAGVTFRPGDFVYADMDGIVVSREPLA